MELREKARNKGGAHMSLSISKVFVLNLKHQLERRHFMLGNLLGWGVPLTSIFFRDAPYCKRFSSPSEVKEAAKADGFAFFRDIYADFAVDDSKSICITWGMCSILREIAESDVISVATLDDVIFFGDFWALNKVFDQRFRGAFDPRSNEFRVLQLDRVHTDRAFEKPFNENDDSIITEGIASDCDFALVMSPLGAELLLSEIATQPWSGFAGLFKSMIGKLIPGMFSTSVPFVVEADNSILSQTPDDKGMVR